MQYWDSTKAVLGTVLGGAVLGQYWGRTGPVLGGQYWDSTKAVLVQYWGQYWGSTGPVLGAVLGQYWGSTEALLRKY